MIELLVYTHSDYKYVYDVWLKQTKKYLPDAKIIAISNNIELTVENGMIHYSNIRRYIDRLKFALEKIDPNKVVIFQHEDMFLYDAPNLQVLNELIELVKSDKADMIRLLRVTEPLFKSDLHEVLYENTFHKFSIQPTIIKAKTLLEIVSNSMAEDIWKFEQECDSKCLKYRSYFPYTGEPKRGMAHYDSSIYPYIATAVVKGHWNHLEYRTELTNILGT